MILRIDRWGTELPPPSEPDPAPARLREGRAAHGEIEGDSARRDVHDRRNIVVVDPDIVLLFGVEGLASRGLGDFDLGGTTHPICRMEPPLAVGGEVEKAAGNHGSEKHGS